MDQPLDLAFRSEVPNLTEDDLRDAAEGRLRKLAQGHTDMIGASVAVEVLGSGQTPHRFQARVVAYIRPSNIAATEKGDSPQAALKGALDALERQVRARRDDLGRPWERPS